MSLISIPSALSVFPVTKLSKIGGGDKQKQQSRSNSERDDVDENKQVDDTSGHQIDELV